MGSAEKRRIDYIGSSFKDLNKLPQEVKAIFEFGIMQASRGEKHIQSKPLKGFGGASILEIVEDHKSGTYRAVYTVRFKNSIYVLHVFQKKSKQGRETPKQDIELIKQRLKRAELDYKHEFGSEG